MTTPRIEEMVEELWNKMCEDTCIACNGTGIHYDKVACSLCEGHGFEAPEKYLTQALTEAHQAGRDEAVEVIKDYEARMSELHSKMIGNAHEDSKIMLAFDIHSRLIAIKHIIKALQDNK